MEQFANININNNDHTFPYLISYIRDENTSVGFDNEYGVKLLPDNICLINSECNIDRDRNTWKFGGYEDNLPSEYIPKNYKTAKIRLYSSQFSVDLFTRTFYALDVYTYIRGKQIVLGSYLFSKADMLACGIINKGENKYCEYIEFNIIDPYYMIYSDDWRKFREKICEEKRIIIQGISYELNNECPTLYFSLTPVVNEGDIFIVTNGYSGGQNSLNVDDPDYLSVNIAPDFSTEGPIHITGVFDYNKEYHDLVTYIMETYDIWDYFEINDINIPCGTEIENIYIGIPQGLLSNICNIPSINVNNIDLYDPFGCEVDEFNYQIGSLPTRTKFEINDIIYSDLYKPKIEYEFMISDGKKILYYEGPNKLEDERIDIDTKNICLSWDDFNEGIFMACSITVSDKKDHTLIINSNKIPLTQDLFKYFINCDENRIFNIDFNKNTLNDMKIININAVNKIVNEVIQLDNISEDKKNIIQPVFFKMNPLQNLLIHPAITENICINLDSYKSKVKKFSIQICGRKFEEIGKVSAGVIFKIIGSQLNKDINEGTYYILNESSEVVSMGKYKFE